MGFINEDIIIDFPVSSDLQYVMQKCEYFDKNDNYGAYENYAFLLTDVLSKEAFVQGHLTKKQWETIQERYVL